MNCRYKYHSMYMDSRLACPCCFEDPDAVLDKQIGVRYVNPRKTKSIAARGILRSVKELCYWTVMYVEAMLRRTL